MKGQKNPDEHGDDTTIMSKGGITRRVKLLRSILVQRTGNSSARRGSGLERGAKARLELEEGRKR